MCFRVRLTEQYTFPSCKYKIDTRYTLTIRCEIQSSQNYNDVHREWLENLNEGQLNFKMYIYIS